MVFHIGNWDPGFLEDLTDDRVFQAFAGLDESGEHRMLSDWPDRLPAKDAAVGSIVDQHDDGGICAGETEETAFLILAREHMPGLTALGWAAALPTKPVAALPGRHGAGVSENGGVFARKERADFPQIAIGPEFRKGRRLVV